MHGLSPIIFHDLIYFQIPLPKNGLHRFSHPKPSAVRVRKKNPFNIAKIRPQKQLEMDSINFVNLKTEKTNTFKRSNSLLTITTLFRLIELFFLFTLLSKLSSQFLFKLTFSGDYFKRVFSILLLSPRFVFIIGNAIVVILFLKYSQNSDSYKSDNKISESYREHVEKREYLSKNVGKRENEVVKERKVISRSKSGDIEKVPEKQLRRSTTEMSRASFLVAEEMSGEEFRQRVEDFIARQQRSLREDVNVTF